MENYEQKYKDLLERARKMRDENCDGCKICLESLFPELAESEDEKIRKWLEETIESMSDNNIIFKDVRRIDVLHWLEKQGESKLAESEDESIRKAQLDYWRSVGGKEWYGVPVQETIAWLEKQENSPILSSSSNIGKDLQVDGFDTELNALLKKYEHLSKKELQEPLEFYLGVVRDDLDIVREEKPKWNEEMKFRKFDIITNGEIEYEIRDIQKNQLGDWVYILYNANIARLSSPGAHLPDGSIRWVCEQVDKQFKLKQRMEE